MLTLVLSKLETLKNHQGFRRYASNTSWLLGEKVLRLLVGLFVGIWVARYLGPKQFGLFSYAQSFVGLFTVFATLGLDGIVVSELVKDESRRDELIGTVFWLKLMGAFIVLLMLLIAVNITANDSQTNLLIFIIASAIILQSFNVIDLYFQSKVLSRYVVFANIISLLMSSIVKIVLILNAAPLIAFAWTILFDSAVLALAFIYYFKKYSKFEIKLLKFKVQTAISLLKDSWPLIFSGILVSVYMQIDQVMIKEMLDNESVGFYSVGVRLTSVLFVIPTVITSSFFPSIVNARNTNKNLYISRIQKLYTALLWSSLIISFAIHMFSHEIVSSLYGQTYYVSVDILKVIIWNFVLISLSSIHGKWLTAEGLLKYSMIYSFIGVITNITANFFFIKEFGAIGAAYATLISQLVPYLYILINPKLRVHLYFTLNSFLCPIKDVNVNRK